MVPVLLGAGAALLVVFGIKALQSRRGEHVPAPEQPPAPETPITDGGLPGGTG